MCMLLFHILVFEQKNVFSAGMFFRVCVFSNTLLVQWVVIAHMLVNKYLCEIL